MIQEIASRETTLPSASLPGLPHRGYRRTISVLLVIPPDHHLFAKFGAGLDRWMKAGTNEGERVNAVLLLASIGRGLRRRVHFVFFGTPQTMVGNDATWALSGAPAEVACFHGEPNLFVGFAHSSCFSILQNK